MRLVVPRGGITGVAAANANVAAKRGTMIIKKRPI